jgi:PASTA domain
MPLSFFNMAVSLAVLNNNRNVAGKTALADSVVAGLLPNGLGLAFPLIVNAQQQPSQQSNAGTQGSGGQQALALTPDVVGNDPATAATTVRQAQLTSTTQLVAVADSVVPNTVVRQDPQGEIIVPVGSNVSLFVSPPEATNTVAQYQALEHKLEGAFAESVGKKIGDSERKVLAETERMLAKQETKLSESLAKKVGEAEPKLLKEIELMLDRKLPKKP